MFWLLYLLPAALAAWKVGSHYGFLAGLATLIAVPVVQTVLLFWLSDRMNGIFAKPPAVETPRQRAELPLQAGARAHFKRLLLLDDAQGRRDATRRLYDDLMATIGEYLDVESGGEGSDAAMVSSMELAALHEAAMNPDDALVVFRSRDLAWSGFRFGNESFRFRYWVIAAVRFADVLPAKGGGYYEVTLEFKFCARNRPPGTNAEFYRSSRFELLPSHSDPRSEAIAAALTEIARVLGARYEYQRYMDA